MIIHLCKIKQMILTKLNIIGLIIYLVLYWLMANLNTGFLALKMCMKYFIKIFLLI